jgi:hypothetical protein
VQSGGSSEDLDFVISEGAPSLIADGTKAEFKVDLRNKEYKRLTGHMLWITLRCDFLFDCHGLRVDGNNDGIAGGTFESWVSVITHDEYELLKREGRS